MAGKEKRPGELQRLDYRPMAPYRLDLEVFSVSELRGRVGRELRSTHRYAFYQLVYVMRGECTQQVDFRPVRCGPDSLLAVRPGQAHNFGLEEDWDGWLVLFRPEFIASSPGGPDLKLALRFDGLPEHLRLHGRERRIVSETIARMREDAGIDAPPAEINALLRYELYALLLRVGIVHDRQETVTVAGGRALQRYRRFQTLVEENLVRWHQVAEYAKELGCSERSLTRTTKSVAGTNAKAFVVARIILEAKRLLAHTSLSVGSIGESLGFEEATNFTKFFKREVRCTPAEFRRRQNAVGVRDRRLHQLDTPRATEPSSRR